MGIIFFLINSYFFVRFQQHFSQYIIIIPVISSASSKLLPNVTNVTQGISVNVISDVSVVTGIGPQQYQAILDLLVGLRALLKTLCG